MDIFPKWSPRNPLEVIAIFIALIYGICALLLGVSADTLEKHNQTTMVWFVVLFPVAVLVVFGWLVRNHHTKLYAPGDYRSDDAFHGAPAASASLASRLQAEIAEVDSEHVEANEGIVDDPVARLGPESPSDVTPTPEQVGSAESSPHYSAQKAYLAEGLAFQELQKEFNASVRRHLRVPTVDGRSRIVDGVLETADGIYIVEIKSISFQRNAPRRIREVFHSLNEVTLSHFPKGSRAIAVFIVDDEDERLKVASLIYNIQLNKYSEIEVRVFLYSNLVQKYGFDLSDR